MPTAARLFSAIYFGFLTYVGAHIVHAIFEADVGYDLDWGNFNEITALIGVLIGWKVQGKRVGDSTNFAVQGGILTSVAIVFWAIVLWSLVEMIQESMKLKYSSATGALVDTFRIGLEYGVTIGTMQFILTMLIGGVIGGYMAEWTNRRYR